MTIIVRLPGDKEDVFEGQVGCPDCGGLVSEQHTLLARGTYPDGIWNCSTCGETKYSRSQVRAVRRGQVSRRPHRESRGKPARLLPRRAVELVAQDLIGNRLETGFHCGTIHFDGRLVTSADDGPMPE